jgi:hypothetical protein
LIGEMGLLMGGPAEIYFLLHPKSGRPFSILAQPIRTKGFGRIAVRQHARVRVRRFGPDIDGAMIDHGTERPHFVALEYELLRER